MANAFKTYTANTIGFEVTNIHTAAGGATETIIGLTLANVTSGAVEANIVHFSSAGVTTRLLANAPIAKGGALVPIGGEQKIVLETGCSIKASTNTANSVDIILSVLEQT
jgi:hypothetical protein